MVIGKKFINDALLHEPMEPQRIQKLIANAGLCSRRKAEELIAQNKVTVNGKTIKLGDKARADDKILVDGKPLFSSPNRPAKRYLLFCKPKGMVTSLEDPHETNTVGAFIKDHFKERLIPVGRLDKMTEGLLILTNDGDFANKIMHPRYEIEKTYYVLVDKPFTLEHRKQLEQGILIEGKKTWPAKIRKVTENEFEITIHEGRNRIVRKMMEALGYFVIRLVRVKIGSVEIGRLMLGKWRELSGREVESFLLLKTYPL